MKRVSGNAQLNTIPNILKTRGKYISLDLYRTYKTTSRGTTRNLMTGCICRSGWRK